MNITDNLILGRLKLRQRIEEEMEVGITIIGNHRQLLVHIFI